MFGRCRWLTDPLSGDRSAMERQEKWPEDWTDAEAWRVRLEEVHKMQWKNEDGTTKHPTRSAEHFKKRVLPYSVH